MQLSKKERRAKRKRKKAERRKGRKTMKRIEIPADITIKVPGPRGFETGEQSLKQFLKAAVESNKLYGQGLANIKRGMKLLEIIEKNCEGETLVLEDADYDAIKAAVDTTEWQSVFVLQMGTLIEAVENAETFVVKEKPKEEAKTESAETDEAKK